MARRERTSTWGIAFRNTMRALVFVVVPLFMVGLIVSPILHAYGYDFRIFRHAGNAYLHGRSPYPPPNLKVLARQHSFVYPAPMALLFAPFALLPQWLGSFLFSCGMAAATVGTMRVLGVSDRRLYAVPFLFLPVDLGVRLGTISPLLALLVAALWRYRDRWRPAALLLAAIIVAKLFLAPLAVWLLVTRRWQAAVAGTALAVVATLAAWAPIGFAGFGDYWHILSLLATGEAAESFSVVSLGLVSGLGSHAAHLTAEVVATLVLVAAVTVGWRNRSRVGDFTAFTLTIGAALAASPIVWNHYFVLLLVPLAIVAPRLAPIWWAPLVLWLVPAQSAHHVLPITVGVVAPAVVLGWTILVARRAARAGVDVTQRPTFG